MKMGKATDDASIEQFDLVLGSYLLEAERLGHIAESEFFPELISRFEDYNAYLSTLKSKSTSKLLHSASNSGNTIDIIKGSRPLEKLLSCTHIAACCDLFAGTSFPLAGGLERDTLRLFVSNVFNKLRGVEDHKIVRYFDKLNSADAVRTIQTLKLLGLVAADTHTCRQLSFGVGNATKDLYSIHLVPAIHRHPGNVLAVNPAGETLDFNIEKRVPRDVLLVDNHPDAEAYFQRLNEKWNGQVIGFNKDAYELLEELPTSIRKGELKPRDFIVCLRFDHLMLPDVEQFFRYIGNVIDEEADLVMSIGAGHTDEEFEGRLKKTAEIFTCLGERKLNPLRIKLYRGNSTKEKRERPGLGAPQYATYEIIYCKLKRKRLS